MPQRADQVAHRSKRGSKGDRPPALNAAASKGRSAVERSCNTHEQWPELATRYDKHGIGHPAAHVLSAVVTWLDLMGDTP